MNTILVVPEVRRRMSRRDEADFHLPTWNFVDAVPPTDVAGAVEAADRGRSATEALRIPHTVNAAGKCGASACVDPATEFGRDGESMRMSETLLCAADNALYKAKREKAVALGVAEASYDGLVADIDPSQ